jgi:hypothetical protein
MIAKMTLNKKTIIGPVSFLVLLTFFILQFFPITETVLATGETDTDDVIVTLDVTSGIAITNGDDVVMLPNIGVTENSSIGSSNWNVKTNAAAGYTLAVKAITSPALKSGSNSFADYTEALGTCSDPSKTTRVTCEATPAVWTPTPETWSVASGNMEFGYSAYGTDVTTMGIWGTGSSCGTAGVPEATLNYAGFTTSNNTIATGTMTNLSVNPLGVTTTICFAAEQKNIYAPSGTYTATITATATTL